MYIIGENRKNTSFIIFYRWQKCILLGVTYSLCIDKRRHSALRSEACSLWKKDIDLSLSVFAFSVDDLKEESVFRQINYWYFRKNREQNYYLMLPMQVVTGLSWPKYRRYRKRSDGKIRFLLNRCKASFTMEMNTVRR